MVGGRGQPLLHEIFKPSGAAAALKLDKQDATSRMDGSNSAVSSAYTRSVILELRY